jgi:hypothetical protein
MDLYLCDGKTQDLDAELLAITCRDPTWQPSAKDKIRTLSMIKQVGDQSGHHEDCR